MLCCAVTRPTVFIEIIERLGCTKEVKRDTPAAAAAASESAASQPDAAAAAAAAAGVGISGGASNGAADLVDVIEVRGDGVVVEQAAGCGGFGKGNFSELFKR
jgi:hypothetical protein